MENWTIRRAKASDALALATRIDAAYSYIAERGITLPAVSEGIAGDIGNNVVWVAVLEDRIVGGLILIPRENYVVIANVAVEPSATGLGLGRALMNQAETEARNLGQRKLKLSTHIDIPENVELYEHLGWQETGRSGDKVQMEKLLVGQ